MRKKVAKHSETSGKVYVPVAHVGKEVEIVPLGNNSFESLVEMIVEKTLFKLKIHEKEPMNRTEPEKKIFRNSGKINLDDLACRPNNDFCGTTGDAITDELCKECENPRCKHFYEKKNWCNKENKNVQCNGNLRNCEVQLNRE